LTRGTLMVLGWDGDIFVDGFQKSI
jgi:hypothetical protein